MSTILESGTLIHARYRVVQLIGQGGMGAVYTAIDETFGSQVALKQMVPTPHLNPSQVAGIERAFQREAPLLHRLQHPALSHVRDSSVAASGRFLVMPACTEATIRRRPHLPLTQPLSSSPAPAPHRPRWLRFGRLVALVLVLVFLGVGLAGCSSSGRLGSSERRDQTDTPGIPTGTMPISPENAATVVQLARLGKGSIHDVAWSPDGRQLAVASAIGLFLYDADTLKEIHQMAKTSITRVAFAPDGATLASVSMYDTIGRLWQAADGKLLHTFNGHTGGVWSVAFAPDGATLASGSWDTTVRLWRVTGVLLNTINAHTGTGMVWSVAFAPDGATLASVSYDNSVRLWRVADGTLLRTLEGHTDWIRSVAFAPDGQTLASASYDKTVRLWRVADGTLLHTLEGHTDLVNSVAFSPDGETLASASYDTTVRLWRVADGTLLHTLEGHTNLVESVAFAPDGKTLASGSLDGTVRLWGVPGEQVVAGRGGAATQRSSL